MASKPQHSWAKIYKQGWNMSLRDPITKSQNGSNNNFRFNTEHLEEIYAVVSVVWCLAKE